MEENRPSIDDIIIQWFHDHGKRFRKDNRQDAIRELVETMAHYGYSRGAIEGAKPKIMKCLVGPSSPRGSKGLKEWNGIADSEFKYVISRLFTPIAKPASGSVVVPFTPGTDIPAEASPELESEEAPVYDEANQLSEEEYNPYFKPELDRSRFKNVKVTPVMTPDEFWASLESETDEQ